MKRRKGMQLGAVLAAVLLVSMAFVPAVTAQVAKDQNQLEASDLDINNISAEQIESLMTDEQKKLFEELAKQEFSIIQVGKDKIITVPAIDANGKISRQNVKLTLLSRTDDTDLYLAESSNDKELLTIQHIGKDTRVSGYVYDGTNGIDKDDVAALRDHGDKKYDVWVEDGYLRLWLSPVVVSGGAMVSDATFTAAILLALEAAGIVITAAISAGIVLIVAVVVGIAYILYPIFARINPISISVKQPILKNLFLIT